MQERTPIIMETLHKLISFGARQAYKPLRAHYLYPIEYEQNHLLTVRIFAPKAIESVEGLNQRILKSNLASYART